MPDSTGIVLIMDAEQGYQPPAASWFLAIIPHADGLQYASARNADHMEQAHVVEQHMQLYNVASGWHAHIVCKQSSGKHSCTAGWIDDIPPLLAVAAAETISLRVAVSASERESKGAASVLLATTMRGLLENRGLML